MVITQSTTITAESRIYIEDSSISILEEYCGLSMHIYHKIFNEINHNPDYNKNELQKQCRLDNNVHVRLFKSLYILAKGQIDSQKEIIKDNIKKTETKIIELNGILNSTNLKKKGIIHYLKQKINRKTNNLRVLNKKLKKPISITFGTKEFYKKQFSKKDNPKFKKVQKSKGPDYSKDHELWRKEWRRKRNNHLYFVGSKDESHGNNLCQLLDSETLRLTLPDCMSQYGKYIILKVNFDHKGCNYDLLQKAVINKQALTYTITQKDNGKWYVSVSFRITSNLKEENYNGCIGIDTNYGLFTTASVKNDGNPDYFEDYEYNPENLNSNQIDQELSRIVSLIVERAKEENRFIVVEDLDLQKKKTVNHGSRKNRKLHMIPYSKFFKLLFNRCIKENILIRFINPSYTSVIARYKYSKNYGRTTHSLASFVIGRRGMGLKEQVPNKIQDKVHRGQKYSVKLFNWNLVSRELGKSYPSGFSLRNINSKKINLTPILRYDNSMSYPLIHDGGGAAIRKDKRTHLILFEDSDNLVNILAIY